MVFVALAFALFTGMLILSEIGADFREWLTTYRATPGAQTEAGREDKKKERKKWLISIKKDQNTAVMGKGFFEGFFSRNTKKKEASFKSGSDIEESGAGALSSPVADMGFVHDLNLEDFDLDDIESDIDDLQPSFTADDGMRDLASAHDAKKADGTLDDDISSLYTSAIDAEKNDNEDVLCIMGDGLSTTDVAAYNASDDFFYDYGNDDAEQEEQYEPGNFSGGGVDDDDLLASLKSDIDDLKKKDENVLLRDLQDFKFTSQDLVDDLNDIVTMITKPQK
jgi:hypothetical protein